MSESNQASTNPNQQSGEKEERGLKLPTVPRPAPPSTPSPKEEKK